jgi:biotin carboxylase
LKNLVIIGASDFQVPLIKKAKELGYKTHVFAWSDGSEGEKIADVFYPISITEKEQILEICKTIKPQGICTIASDLATVAVNYIAEKLNLPGNPNNITAWCTNKYLMREKLHNEGIYTPRFYKINSKDSIENIEIAFPAIVKPTDRSGSRGICKVERAEEIFCAVKNAESFSFEKSAILEEFIEGDEYSCECISQDGIHHFLTITKKFTTGAPDFIETGHIQPATLTAADQRKVIEEVFKALNALEIQNGASHTEFKIDTHGNVRIIEIGARMGGDCIGSDLVHLSTGHDFLKYVIDVAVGEKLQLHCDDNPCQCAIRFILTEDDIEEYNHFVQTSREKIYKKSMFDMNNLGKTYDSSSRIGYYIYMVDDKGMQ